MSEEFIFNAFINLEAVQRCEDGFDVRKFRSFNHSTCKTVLSLSKAPIHKLEISRTTSMRREVCDTVLMLLACQL